MTQIAGQVSTSGQDTIGTNLFSAGNDSTGMYTVSYTTAFPSEPVVVATPLGSGSQADSVCVSNSTSEGFALTIKTPSGNLVNRGFNFISTDQES